MKRHMLVSSYFYTHISHLLSFDTDDVVSFDIKYFSLLILPNVFNGDIQNSNLPSLTIEQLKNFLLIKKHKNPFTSLVMCILSLLWKNNFLKYLFIWFFKKIYLFICYMNEKEWEMNVSMENRDSVIFKWLITKPHKEIQNSTKIDVVKTNMVNNKWQIICINS